ncbi:MAG: MBL fold metallo-hydrolase [Desulfobacteraceae bacterium]|nr:MBL fold metallo-hydrolase [Desulfobacteraceae bacterium]
MTSYPEHSRVVILGSGTCVPSLRRSACAVMVTCKESRVLFDVGPGTTRRLLEAGGNIFDVTHVFISHFHPDHTGELVPFLFATKYPGSGRRKIPLCIIGGPGFLDFYDGLKAVYGDWMDLGPDTLDIREISPDLQNKLKFKDFQVDIAPVSHRPESLAFKLTTPADTAMVYSGDTQYTDSLVNLSEGANLLICESAMPDEMAVPGHMTPSQAGKTATRAKVSRLVLTHLYPECDAVDIAKQCRSTYKGPLIIAEDLMEIVL